ncbi:MAG: stage IV sporulation protein A, partial [Defluviitaleaceae bacterium]|nr:stage IV sporulation protein A [Defluviitaleaceae bacterium]
LYTDDEIDKAEYLEKNARLKAETEHCNMEIARLKEEKKAVNTTAARLSKVKEFFATLSAEDMQAAPSKEDLGEISPALHVAQAMLESVTILKDSTNMEMKIRIEMKLGDTTDCTLATFSKRNTSEHFMLDTREIEKVLQSDLPYEGATTLETTEFADFADETSNMYSHTEISPLVGSESQSNDLIAYINDEMAEDPTRIWELNMFGKSMHDMVRDGLQNKLFRMPEAAQMKFQETLQKIINEGSGGLICIML